MSRRARGPGRLLTRGNLGWVWRHRAWTPWHLRCYARMAWLRWRQPGVRMEGLVFLGRRVEIYARPGLGRVVLGRWVHVGDGTRIRCHEGTVRIGDKVVFGQYDVVNAYLDVEIGAATILADWVYVTDFDHAFDDRSVPIKDQGIVKSPVRIGPDVWVGTKASVLRGADVGEGCVLAAHTVVRGEVAPYQVVAGVPGRVVRSRGVRPDG